MMKCPECGGSLRVHKTYYPRQKDIFRRQYSKCDNCGQRRTLDTVDRGPPVHRNGYQNGQAKGKDDLEWTEVQAKLRCQMSQATFDAHIKPTRLVARQNGCVIIGVKSPATKAWLENRLYRVVERTLTAIDETIREIKFIEE